MSKRPARLAVIAISTIAAFSSLTPAAHAWWAPTDTSTKMCPTVSKPSYVAGRGTFQVTEEKGYTDTGIWVRKGDKVVISPSSDTIWAGLWFTGRNGPNGMTDRLATSWKFPLINGNDACGRNVFQYSLLAEVPGQRFQVGYGQETMVGESGTVRLRINDDIPDNGDGHFAATVTVYRPY